ncbi:hypothetical protein TNCV_1955651 [Trichonephila clavipes]|nr:hypothetical protein TNCV_1955651 [Trichonephila clavipes]
MTQADFSRRFCRAIRREMLTELDIRHYTTHTHSPYMGSHYPHFPTAIKKLFLSDSSLQNSSRCQDPCIEAPPTGLLPLVQSQCFTSQHENTTISHAEKDFCQG